MAFFEDLGSSLGLTKNDVQRDVQSLNDAIANLDECKKRLQNNKSALSPFWEGAAYSEFCKLVDKMTAETNAMIGKLQWLQRVLNLTYDSVYKADQSGKDAANKALKSWMSDLSSMGRL